MLGKRRKQFAMPPHKKPAYIRTTQRDIPGPKQYGRGYNPKAISHRKPPPNLERKWLDSSSSTSSWVAPGSGLPSHTAFDNLLKLAQGDEGYQRQGNKIMVTKITLRFTSQLDQNSNSTFNSTTPGDVYFRWFLIIDTQANGAFPAITDIFEERPTTGDSYDVFNSLLECGRYKVLMDKYVREPAAAPMYNSTTGHTQVPKRLIHHNKTFDVNLPVQYSDGLANLASIRNNNLLLIVFNGHDGTNTSVNWRARVRFTDY